MLQIFDPCLFPGILVHKCDLFFLSAPVFWFVTGWLISFVVLNDIYLKGSEVPSALTSWVLVPGVLSVLTLKLKSEVIFVFRTHKHINLCLLKISIWPAWIKMLQSLITERKHTQTRVSSSLFPQPFTDTTCLVVMVTQKQKNLIIVCNLISRENVTILQDGNFIGICMLWVMQQMI